MLVWVKRPKLCIVVSRWVPLFWFYSATHCSFHRYNLMSVILLKVFWKCTDVGVEHLHLHRGWQSLNLQNPEVVGEENGNPRLDPGKLH